MFATVTAQWTLDDSAAAAPPVVCDLNNDGVNEVVIGLLNPPRLRVLGVGNSTDGGTAGLTTVAEVPLSRSAAFSRGRSPVRIGVGHTGVSQVPPLRPG